MACFCRERHQDVTRVPHTVHCGFHRQLRGTHSPARGAVRAAAAEAEVFPSQQVSPGRQASLWDWPLTGRGLLVRPPASTGVGAGEGRGSFVP